jgi:HicA toxin of bacterial toxin-antitoxin,
LLRSAVLGIADVTPRGAPVPLKVSEMIKLIEADGWYPVATRGSHRQYKHPAKPGRVTQVLDEMRRAIEFHLAGLREDGQPIPHPSTVAATVISLDAA